MLTVTRILSRLSFLVGVGVGGVQQHQANYAYTLAMRDHWVFTSIAD